MLNVRPTVEARLLCTSLGLSLRRHTRTLWQTCISSEVSAVFTIQPWAPTCYSYSVFKTATAFPSIQYRINDMLVVRELNAVLLENRVDDTLLLTALTTPSASMAFDYERLELLGSYNLFIRSERVMYSRSLCRGCFFKIFSVCIPLRHSTQYKRGITSYTSSRYHHEQNSSSIIL